MRKSVIAVIVCVSERFRGMPKQTLTFILISHCRHQSYAQVLVFADRYQLRELFYHAISVFKDNFNSLVKSDDWGLLTDRGMLLDFVRIAAHCYDNIDSVLERSLDLPSMEIGVRVPLSFPLRKFDFDMQRIFNEAAEGSEAETSSMQATTRDQLA